MLLHGALGDCSELKPLEKELETSFNCYTHTFYGHGLHASSKQPYNMELFVEEAKSLIQENPLLPVDIFGYSMGGFVALLLAKKHPHLVNKITTYGTQFNWTTALAAAEIRKLQPEKIEEKVPAFAKHLEKIHGPFWKNVVARTAQMMQALGEHNPLNEDALQSIQSEICILRGEKDAMVEEAFSKYVSLLLPNAKYHEITEGGHTLSQVNIKMLTSFIAES